MAGLQVHHALQRPGCRADVKNGVFPASRKNDVREFDFFAAVGMVDLQAITGQVQALPVVENWCRDPLAYVSAMDYLQHAFSNMMAHPEGDQPSPEEIEQFEQVALMFMSEVRNVYLNFSQVFAKYCAQSGPYVNVDRGHTWFDGPTVCGTPQAGSGFAARRHMTAVLTILTKICLFVSEYCLQEVEATKRQHEYVEARARQATALERLRWNMVEQFARKRREAAAARLQGWLRDTEGLRQYWAGFFVEMSEYPEHMSAPYLSHVPSCVWQVFDLPLSCLHEQEDTLRMVVALFNQPWVQTATRMPWLRAVMAASERLHQQGVSCGDGPLRYFRPTADRLVEDYLSVFWQFKKDSHDPSAVRDLVGICLMLTTVLRQTHDLDVPTQRLVTFISALVTTMTRLYQERSSGTSDQSAALVPVFNAHLELCHLVLEQRPAVLDSYLCYYLVNTLLGFLVDLSCLDADLLGQVWSQLQRQPMVPVYLGCLATPEHLVQLSRWLGADARQTAGRWSRLFALMAEDPESAELQDMITSCQVLVPCYLPLESGQQMLVDRHVIKAYLWENQVNPLTRKPLSIEELDTYNGVPERAREIESVRERLRLLIERAKKLADAP